MKVFRKNEQGLFICEECGFLCKGKMGIGKHIKIHNMTSKDYYDKYLKEDGEGICYCGKSTKFNTRNIYNISCCSEHLQFYKERNNIQKYGVKSHLSLQLFKDKKKETCLKRYGVECTLNSKEITDKIKQTNLVKYGSENPFGSNIIKDKIKETWIKNYGVDNPNKDKIVRNKIKTTCQEKFGTDYALQNKKVRSKISKTLIKKYGVEHALQNKELLDKAQKNAKTQKKYKETNLWYQASYEFDFLENYYKIFKDEIQRGPSIKYKFENKNKIYHPDFFIPSLNLIIEIKNDRLYKRFKDKCIAKEKATIANGFKYILILNKDYDEFEKLIN